MPPKARKSQAAAAATTDNLASSATTTKKPRSRSAKPKKEKDPKVSTASTKNKRQKKDLPLASTADTEKADGPVSMADQTTKSTFGLQEAAEESKAESQLPQCDDNSASKGVPAEEQKKSAKPKKGRNRTKVVPSVAAADYIADSDGEEFKQLIAKIETGEPVEDSSSVPAGGKQEEASSAGLENEELAAALDDLDSEDGSAGEGSKVVAEKEVKEPNKAKTKVVKDKPAKAKKAEAPAKATAAEPNKNAKAQPTKVMMNEKEAKAAVASYMEAQNRPYSLQNVMDNMHGRIVRKICQQVLDDLTDEKHLVCKEFGKAKIYMANQDKFAETSKDELAQLDA